MIRAKLIEALKDKTAWRVESPERILRVSDGLWVSYCTTSYHLSIGSNDHGAAQAMLDTNSDAELRDAYFAVTNIGIGTDRERRPIMDMLGVPQ